MKYVYTCINIDVLNPLAFVSRRLNKAYSVKPALQVGRDSTKEHTYSKHIPGGVGGGGDGGGGGGGGGEGGGGGGDRGGAGDGGGATTVPTRRPRARTRKRQADADSFCVAMLSLHCFTRKPRCSAIRSVCPRCVFLWVVASCYKQASYKSFF